VLRRGRLDPSALAAQGRWKPRPAERDQVNRLGWAMALGFFICAILTWVLLAGPIFQAPSTDQSVKAAIVLIIPVCVVDASMRLRRERRRSRRRPVTPEKHPQLRT
jgi:hypothetical protein